MEFSDSQWGGVERLAETFGSLQERRESMEPLGMHWEMVTYLHMIVEIFLTGYVLYRFAGPFMENKIGAAVSGAVYFAVMTVLYLVPVHMMVFNAYGLGILAAFFVMCFMDRRNYRQKIFLAVTFFSLRWFSFAMAEILYDNLYSFAEKTEYMRGHPDLWFALFVGVCVYWLLLELIFLAAGIWCILRAYAYKYAAMSRKELFMLISPSIMGVAGYEIIWYYRSFYISETGRSPSVYDSLALLYYAVAVITIIVVTVLYQGIKAGQEEKLQNELLAAQVESIQHHISQVESVYQNVRGIRHDLANHIITLEELYAGNRKEEALNYADELKTQLAKVSGEIKSGNPVTDVILQGRKYEAEKRKIRFCCDFHYPIESGINAFDLSVILNNALQNAIENAAGAKPYISILSYRKRNACMIEISNSFVGNLQWNVESGLPFSSKEKSDRHGYGLANIRRTAVKYCGDIDIAAEDGEFRLTIMLMADK